MTTIFSRCFRHGVAIPAVLAALLVCAMPAAAGPVLNLPGFHTDVLSPNDDGSTGAAPIGFTINFFGVSYSSVYVNNNGNITFTGPLGTFTPFSLLSTATPVIAPFFGDVDTRGDGSGVVSYGNDTYSGYSAFGVEWPQVGYFAEGTNKLNTFELMLLDRSDTGAGNFDIYFNYDQIQWETGNASGGSNGLGGSSARAGYSNGVGASLELAGSAVNGALIDGGPNALTTHSLNSGGVLGRYIFSAREGSIEPPPDVP